MTRRPEKDSRRITKKSRIQKRSIQRVTKEKDMQSVLHILFCRKRRLLHRTAFAERGHYMRYQVQENCLTIFLPNELDHHNAEDIRRESDHLIEKNHIRYVIFDFEETNFMDSSGIGVIMGRYKRLYMLGGEVCAVHTSERMRKILTMSGVTKIMQIYEEDQ